MTSGTRGRVLKAGDEITLTRFPKGGLSSDKIWQRFNHERFKSEGSGVLLLGARRLLELRLHAHGSRAGGFVPRALGRPGVARLNGRAEALAGRAELAERASAVRTSSARSSPERGSPPGREHSRVARYVEMRNRRRRKRRTENTARRTGARSKSGRAKDDCPQPRRRSPRSHPG